MRIRREEGFALPITIFIVTLITIMLSALFVRVGVERRIAESGGATVDALALAHSGLQRYYVHYDSLGTLPLNGDSLRVNVTGGYADVVAHIAHNPPGGDRLYLIRSTGHVIEPTQGADPQAVRTVAQFAVWQGGTIDRRGAYVAANRFNDPDGDPTMPDGNPDGTIAISGYDACGLGSIPATRTPLGSHPMSTQTDPPYPPGGSPWSIADLTDVDWAGVIGGDFLPNYTTLVNLNTWSSYLITAGTTTLTDVVGSGLLVVTGDLLVTGNTFNWRGVIMVGGRIQFTATTMQVSGIVMSGMNILLPSPPPILTGYWNPAGTSLTIGYNSCRVDSAMVSLGGLAPIPNAWVDNWASY